MERKEGRSFDDSDDEEFQQERKYVKILLEKFDNVEFVLENAALTAALFYYVFNKSEEYYSLLYVYVIRKYIKLNETKNSMRNYNHINMEIYTTFIHDRSILKIQFYDEEINKKIEDTIDSEDCIIYFNKISQHVVRGVLNKCLQQFKETIRLGLESYSYTNKIYEEMNRTKELKILETLHITLNSCIIRNHKTRCLPFSLTDTRSVDILYEFQIRAITLAMNTQYEYFVMSKKYSYIVKHPENLVRSKTFLSQQMLTKTMSKLKIKGHNFEEYSMPRITFCTVCDLILWGPHPNCIFCQNCRNSIHRDCKDTIKCCQTEVKLKKNESIDSEINEINNSKDSSKIQSVDIVLNSGIINSQSLVGVENDHNQSEKHYEKQKPSRKLSISKYQERKSHFVTDKGKKSVKHTKSLNSRPISKPLANEDVTRSESTRSRSRDQNFSNSQKSHNRSVSEDTRLTNSIDPLPVNKIDLDEEMNVLETFEAVIELKQFPAVTDDACITDKEEYQRLLVLLEFHHKTKFTRMSLKRIKYLFVDPWMKMNEYLELFDTLSLCCVEKLYLLIGSLVEVIDSCKRDESYDLEMAQKILNWLTDDNDFNLMRWFQLSTDLCCTNILQSVKAYWTECKQLSPKLSALFSVEINRIPVIEQLSNMRALLFNLPMIVTKIVKDLKKLQKFKDEARIWDLVRHKLSHLPQLIDERCIPVVDLINDGTILSSSLRYKQYSNGNEDNKEMEAFINNFPKTVFKNDFVDFQFVKISNLRQYRQGDLKAKLSSIYVRDEIDAAVIIYDTEIVILQKENEKYFLKQFKSNGEEKLFPLIPLSRIHANKNTAKENKEFPYELTVLLIDQATLAQILFKTEPARDMWFDHIIKTSSNVPINTKIKYNPVTTPVRPITPYNDSTEVENNTESNTMSNSTPVSERITSSKSAFNETMTQIQTLFDLASDDMVANEDGDNNTKRVTSTGAGSPSEFMLEYIHLLKEFVSLGCHMMDESQSLDSNSLLQKDVLRMNKPNLQNISEQMSTLIQSLENETDIFESSKDSTSDDDVIDQTSEASFDIQSFVADVIKESLNQIVQESLDQ